MTFGYGTRFYFSAKSLQYAPSCSNNMQHPPPPDVKSLLHILVMYKIIVFCILQALGLDANMKSKFHFYSFYTCNCAKTSVQRHKYNNQMKVGYYYQMSKSRVPNPVLWQHTHTPPKTCIYYIKSTRLRHKRAVIIPCYCLLYMLRCSKVWATCFCDNFSNCI